MSRCSFSIFRTYIQVAFLNLMSVMAERAGSVHVRVGGNTQETAVLVDSLPDGAMIEKDKLDSSNPTETPTLLFTPEYIYLFANVSALTPVKWYLGIPMNDTSNLRLGIAEVGETILGDNLLGFQLGNEPDLYVSHGHRATGYEPANYTQEFGLVIQAIAADSLIPTRNNLIGPSVSGTWSPEQVWDTGFITDYSAELYALSVEHYPDNNCAAAFPDAGFGDPKDPQVVFQNYLNHTSGTGIVAPYLNSAGIAQQAGKPFIMFETNSASCGGFAGVSDSFGAALWALDYGLQMAYSNFSGALLHVGGVDDTYNPFNPPITNQSTYRSWTIGPVFYSAVAVAETFGRTGQAQIIDMQANSGNMFTPGYAIYDGGSLARVALFNYITDSTGASDYTATISVSGGNVPSSVQVKYVTLCHILFDSFFSLFDVSRYLLAPSVAEKFNITWAGQVSPMSLSVLKHITKLYYGRPLAGSMSLVSNGIKSFDNPKLMRCSDGRLQGTETIESASCDQSAGTCSIKVPAPGFALVFMDSTALSDSAPSATVTFSTTAMTKTPKSTIVIESSVLATAQGMSGSDRTELGSTSKGSSGASRSTGMYPGVAGIISVLAGCAFLMSFFQH
ncbi:hypothetical protein EIP86_011428 [Pleurotus ostreatoroseus]|nr:hypothetical protein EIP86_011428 [Pleurotus ostreatoroseus]